MKTYIKLLRTSVFLTILIGLGSCSIDDVQPVNKITAENTIRDEASAQQVLNGVYDLGRDFDVAFFPLYLAIYGNEGTLTGFLTSGTDFNTNDVPVEIPVLSKLYNGQYKIINTANFLIQELEAGSAADISDERKATILSEARFQRAFAYFNLLRYFGQFYDLNSPLGVVLRSEFSTDVTAQPRNTVQEVYDFIEKDLEFAAANGPVLIEHFYSGSLASKALLAKVKLYTGDYTGAASFAEEVMTNTEGYTLEANYADIFANSFNSSEVLFAPFSGPGADGGSKMDQINRTSYSENLRSLADQQVGTPDDGLLFDLGSGYDDRFSFAYSDVSKGVNMQGKYPFNGQQLASQNNTLYHLRLAEIYLAHAEAETRRAGGDLDAALTSLNAIRLRAGATPKILSDAATLLEDIRREKLLELFFENGEPFFDVVRYHALGDLEAASIKATLTSEDKFILPIPNQVLIGNKEMVQNPGY